MSAVLDASAVLAFLAGEPGAEQVEPRLEGAMISAVNLVEVGTKLVDSGMTNSDAAEVIALLGLRVVAFDENLAMAAIVLRRSTRGAGLSLGDRACLALAEQEGGPAVTADRAWKGVEARCSIEFIR